MTSEEKMRERFIDLFEYKDGFLFWKDDFSARARKGCRAGNINHDGYWRVGVDGKNRAYHRVIFLMMNGWLPEVIDHIDGNPSNNKIENLREASHSQNQHNSKISSYSSTKIKGVTWHRSNKKFTAHYGLNGKHYHVGSFDSIESARKARENAIKIAHGDFANNG